MKSLTIITVFIIISTIVSAQQNTGTDNNATTRLAPTELAIPTSPLFDLLGVAPNQVARTSDIKNFKVDWSFKSWRINPNLSIQAQPVWELFYNRKKLTKYQQASGFSRMLASIDLSIGTVQTENTDRRIGSTVKMNLYKQKDPLLQTEMYNEVEKTFATELIELKEKEKRLLIALDTTFKPSELSRLKLALRDNDVQLTTYYNRRNAAIQAQAAQFIGDNWNAAFIDVAFGKVYTYGTDSTGSLRKLKLNRNTANGGWINFGLGIGKRGLVSGLVRSSFYQEEVTFRLKDSQTSNETAETAIADNKLITLGINFRYGGPIYNFFAEFIYEGKTFKTPLQALNDAFTAPVGKAIITSTVNWDIVHPYTINFGGDWRIGRNVVLNYGLRCLMDTRFKTIAFTPIANISCMMR